MPVLPVYQPMIRAALKNRIRGFVPGGSFFTLLEHNEDWWLARR